MEIILGVPGAFSEQGQKSNQEDRYMPPRPQMAESKCFVLCDGMGGHEHGEVAAEIVSKSLYGFMTKGAPASGEDIMTEERFSEALALTNSELDKMPVTEGKRPGTTMTCLYFAENGVFGAHIGDSRIYQVRPGQGILFRSRDHSLVNDLLRAGELTEEEARTFPRKNVITRAMQPGLDRPFRADTTLLTDVKAGDYFFMCCDGILEQLTDEQLVKILEDSALTEKEKLDAIYDTCFGRTRDNFTCILIPVKEVVGSADPATLDAITAVVDVESPQAEARIPQLPHTKSPSYRKWLYWAIGLIVLAAVAVVLVVLTKSEDKKEEQATRTVTPTSVEEEDKVDGEDDEMAFYGNDDKVHEDSEDDESDSDEPEDAKDDHANISSEVKKAQPIDESRKQTGEELGQIIKDNIQQQNVPPTSPTPAEQNKKKKDDKSKG